MNPCQSEATPKGMDFHSNQSGEVVNPGSASDAIQSVHALGTKQALQRTGSARLDTLHRIAGS